MSVHGVARIEPSQALLICPDRRMCGELARALAAELPSARLAIADAYPDHHTAADAAAGAKLCFLDVFSDTGNALEILRSLAAPSAELPVVILLPENDPDLILKCLRQGAAEFLIQPFTAEQLRTVLAKLARVFTIRAGGAPAGKLYCVAPGAGAAGATTVACNLAFALKRLNGGKVLLADLDGITGTVAFMLRLKSLYSFVDAINHAGGLDAGAWKALVAPGHGIDVLLSPESPVDCYAEPLDPAPLIEAARIAYDRVVIDAGGPCGPWNTSLAQHSGELVIVTTNEPAAVYSTQRTLACLGGKGVNRSSVRLVMNRVPPRTGLPQDAVESALEMPVIASLPSDVEAIEKALMDGKPAAQSTRFGRAISALARSLEGGQPRAAKPSIFAKLISAFR